MWQRQRAVQCGKGHPTRGVGGPVPRGWPAAIASPASLAGARQRAHSAQHANASRPRAGSPPAGTLSQCRSVRMPVSFACVEEGSPHALPDRTRLQNNNAAASYSSSAARCPLMAPRCEGAVTLTRLAQASGSLSHWHSWRLYPPHQHTEGIMRFGRAQASHAGTWSWHRLCAHCSWCENARANANAGPIGGRRLRARLKGAAASSKSWE